MTQPEINQSNSSVNFIQHHEVLLKMSDVVAMTGICRTSIYLKMKKDVFPRSVSVGVRAKRWRLSAIQAWIDQCK